MPGFDGFGKMLVVFGLILVAAGLFIWLGGQWFNLGRLPGDIYVKRGNFTFYFPLVTSIIVSLLLTVILNLLSRR